MNGSVIVFDLKQAHCDLSDWLLLNDKGPICQLYHGENKLHFNEMMIMMFALY